MIVYIEYVIINNFIIDFLLLKTTFILSGKREKLFNLILTSILGAVISLSYPLIKLGAFYLTIIKVLAGVLIVLIASKYKSKREFFINLAIFYSLTFLVGGGVFGILSLLGITEYKELVVSLCFIPACLLILATKGVITYLYRRKNVESFIYFVEIEFCNVKLKGRAFLDTGNGLYSNDSPVIVCDKAFIQKLYTTKEFYKRLFKMEITTAMGSGEKYCLPLDSFKIFIKDKPNIYNNVMLMIAKIDMVGVDILLHPSLLGGEYERESDTKIKKVS